jgi:hypothetical protein
MSGSTPRPLGEEDPVAAAQETAPEGEDADLDPVAARGTLRRCSSSSTSAALRLLQPTAVARLLTDRAPTSPLCSSPPAGGGSGEELRAGTTTPKGRTIVCCARDKEEVIAAAELLLEEAR